VTSSQTLKKPELAVWHIWTSVKTCKRHHKQKVGSVLCPVNVYLLYCTITYVVWKQTAYDEQIFG